jgi:hypothetical protein
MKHFKITINLKKFFYDSPTLKVNTMFTTINESEKQRIKLINKLADEKIIDKKDLKKAFDISKNISSPVSPVVTTTPSVSPLVTSTPSVSPVVPSTSPSVSSVVPSTSPSVSPVVPSTSPSVSSVVPSASPTIITTVTSTNK